MSRSQLLQTLRKLKLPKDPVTLIAGVFLIAFFSVFGASIPSNRVPLLTNVASIPLGWMTYEQATRVLQAEIDRFVESVTIYQFEDHRWELNNTELNLSLDAGAILDSLLPRTHATIIDRFFVTTRNLVGSHNYQIPAEIMGLADTEVNSFIQRNFAVIEEKPLNASVEKNYLLQRLDLIEAKNGIVVDRKQLLTDIRANVADLVNHPISLARVQVVPLTSTTQAQRAHQMGQAMLDNTPYELIDPETFSETGETANKQTQKKMQISEKNVFDWLVFFENKGGIASRPIAFDSKKVADFLKETAGSLERKPVNARLSGNPGETVTIAEQAKNGRALDVPATEDALWDELIHGSQKIDLVFSDIPATITEHTIADLGIQILLGEGTTDFAGSPASRIHNITVADAKYDGILVAPGAQFSFGQHLGEVNAETGYKPELVIKEGKTVPEYGGGICQVSTTLFRSAVYAGLDINQRSPHSYVVRYYGDPGFDATVYPPNPDLVFTNVTNGHIYIQTAIDKTKLTFSIFGPDEKLETKIIGPVVYERGEDGEMKTYLKQQVYKDGEIVREKTFWSHYQSPKLYPVIRNPLE
ncbi:MAG: VanW family protein [Parcubacteria group bacterium GW2011_GWA2_47_8]|nr:MAG: VanW family protein [Parcubacteria group bacterium GW2011_GWA2_47_8]OHB20515.1 MAG: hypothetical protein A2666_03550 [Parcubacteria group bacterium RIFCSPHIGHO2_01_FULL_47_10b]